MFLLTQNLGHFSGKGMGRICGRFQVQLPMGTKIYLSKKKKIGSFQISRRISLAHLVCVCACYLFLVNTKCECCFRSKKDLTCITYLYVCARVHLCEVGRCWGGGLCRYMGMCIYKCFYVSMYVFLYLSKLTCGCVCICLCVCVLFVSS